MQYRQLGAAGLRVPVLSFGAGTFGGKGPLFSAWGDSGTEQARRMVDICLDAGVTLFDTADVYSDGASEEILGVAIKGRRDQLMISTKTGLPLGDGPDDWGVARGRLLRAVEASLRRLGTDYIDILQLHALDASTPVEELLSTLDQLVRDGKVRHVGVSNYPGWQLMKALSMADRNGWPRFVAHQVYYSLIGRDYEAGLMPLGADQGVGALVWSPLGWGRLTGRIRRGSPIPEGSRLHRSAQFAPPVENERLYRVVDALDEVAAETGKSIPQIALAWLIGRPTVSSVIVGARHEAQLRDNLGAVGWSLTPAQVAHLDAASDVLPPYPYAPYRYQEGFARLNPALV
ncbi:MULTISPECIES: aldo/keto reductase [unclassified Modicisalibacter]|uniref:aldo/keto reductase n=1 Tax=unclassified Modicisalibacter TaxID=2679913 RepID=UPI001CCAB94B|nr:MULTISPECIES: aldo/keto reductase [unclassified Modicisalibacter]MBZ9559542.1 aldo/keto reductase [Modicisalibacter sp. R2A 31.J]MBZ9576994.1 aldo/keto reductase [Modicisalibacter sp. MOD 31.J]